MTCFPVDLAPESIAGELAEFQARFARGLGVLRRLPPVDVGTAPKERVYEEGKVALYRYRPTAEARVRVPLIIVYALVNRPYMIDLQPDRSLVRGLLQKGVDVYLIDWGYPDAADRYLALDDYINGTLHRCIKQVCRRHGVDRVNVLGICQGGAFSLCYGALHPDRVRNLITMVTPVDFHTPDNQLTRMMRQLDVDRLVDALGNVPGELLNNTFLSLRPFRLTEQKYVDLAGVLEDSARLLNFLRMEKWIFDSPDQAGAAFSQFVKDFFQGNKLVTGELEIGGARVDLGRVRMPVFNIYATQDHLVPPAASIALGEHVGSEDYQTLAFPGGHIGIYVSARAQREVPPAIAEWLSARDASE